MPCVQITERRLNRAKLRAHVWYRSAAETLFGNALRPLLPEIVAEGTPVFEPFRCRPTFDRGAWDMGKRGLETELVNPFPVPADLRGIPLGTHLRLLSAPENGPTETVGLGVVSGFREHDDHAYIADFLLEHPSCPPEVLARRSGHTLRFTFERQGAFMPGHWSDRLFEPRGESPTYAERYVASGEPWLEPVPEGAIWICLHGTLHGHHGLIYPSPFTDGDRVTVSDGAGPLLTGRIARSAQTRRKPILEEPKPFWSFALHPSSLCPDDVAPPR